MTGLGGSARLSLVSNKTTEEEAAMFFNGRVYQLAVAAWLKAEQDAIIYSYPGFAVEADKAARAVDKLRSEAPAAEFVEFLRRDENDSWVSPIRHMEHVAWCLKEARGERAAASEKNS